MKLSQVLYIEANNLDDLDEKVSAYLKHEDEYVVKAQQLIYVNGEYVQTLELYSID